MKCRFCKSRPRPCRTFMICPSHPKDVCLKCWRKVERAAERFVRALAGERGDA